MAGDRSSGATGALNKLWSKEKDDALSLVTRLHLVKIESNEWLYFLLAEQKGKDHWVLPLLGVRSNMFYHGANTCTKHRIYTFPSLGVSAYSCTDCKIAKVCCPLYPRKPLQLGEVGLTALLGEVGLTALLGEAGLTALLGEVGLTALLL